ncbi:HNH endonuclease [Oceanobacillus arenosus]|uniref:Putative HNH nuclease YajD n=1 Tax=Oceanobacillus arenosus TaxID=1229153 RepID=A0A3D8PRN3_9BACI|nr:HNH endonuclease [Oceanobacillus arenosus]RDW17625.1 HNH endonuclease [Oceanobacillus arenosus]
MSAFHKSRQWINKRPIIFKRDGYICKECSRYGKTTVATMVHHIYPIDTHPQFRLTNDNLISLCNRCHEVMHDRVTNEITSRGIELQNRVRHKLFQSN